MKISNMAKQTTQFKEAKKGFEKPFLFLNKQGKKNVLLFFF